MHAASFPAGQRWGADAMALQLGLPGAFGFLAGPDGFVIARVAADEAEILTLAVVPASRRAGLATVLLQAANARARKDGATAMLLEVSESNEAARALYTRLGFTQVGRRRGYYGTGKDALLRHAIHSSLAMQYRVALGRRRPRNVLLRLGTRKPNQQHLAGRHPIQRQAGANKCHGAKIGGDIDHAVESEVGHGTPVGCRIDGHPALDRLRHTDDRQAGTWLLSVGCGTCNGSGRQPRGNAFRRRHLARHCGAAKGFGGLMESRIERLCIDKGLKMTGQRRIIARVLSETGDHPDVEELYRRAAALDSRISIATVYRTVRLLEEKGILERRDFGGGRARYEPTEHGHHHHMIDVDTGRVIEFEEPEHERLLQEIAARLGFRLVSARLELFGRRPDVQTSPQPRVRDEPKQRLREPAPKREAAAPARQRGVQR
eukprot:gene6708-6779_t